MLRHSCLDNSSKAWCGPVDRVRIARSGPLVQQTDFQLVQWNLGQRDAGFLTGEQTTIGTFKEVGNIQIPP